MKPEIWGKYCWTFIHLIALEYPDNPNKDDKQRYYNYFIALQQILPCNKCRKNLGNHLKNYPINDDVLSSRNNLLKWTIDIHNVVNENTNKPKLNYDQAINCIQNIITPKSSYINYMIMIIILVIILIFFFLKKN